MIGCGRPCTLQIDEQGQTEGKRADSTLRSSQAVPHPSTDRALCCLTSEVERDPVHSTRYGRRRNLAIVDADESKETTAPACSTCFSAHVCCRFSTRSRYMAKHHFEWGQLRVSGRLGTLSLLFQESGAQCCTLQPKTTQQSLYPCGRGNSATNNI